MSGEVPDKIREFMHEHIESYEQLEALVWLHGKASQWWDVEAIANGLHLPSDIVLAALEELTEKSFVEQRPKKGAHEFRHVPTSPHSETIAEVARLRDEQPLEIMRLMNANAIERVRTSMMKSFANAFVLGRKKKDG